MEANSFFLSTSEKGDTIVLSPLFFDEVESKTRMIREDIIEIFTQLKINIELIQTKQEKVSKKILDLNIHFSDALHITYALEEKCDCIVTFNIKDFEKASIFIPIREPTK